jgi:hypothetical protein
MSTRRRTTRKKHADTVLIRRAIAPPKTAAKASSHNQWPHASVIPCQDRNCNHHIMGIKGLAKLLSDEAPDVRSVQTSVFV